ncbi:hypothetical protein K2173_016346 [Erythroxylum novogranatense]|uniref:Uncharacterized protein n=1 Tax=Erythroxylum novogranatense TaxID=1862640 RepID=A0AAV8SG49_9ROSI|nr:hypothetical protein K2173_016346 [Erythroxylum novogranatense]
MGRRQESKKKRKWGRLAANRIVLLTRREDKRNKSEGEQHPSLACTPAAQLNFSNTVNFSFLNETIFTRHDSIDINRHLPRQELFS